VLGLAAIAAPAAFASPKPVADSTTAAWSLGALPPTVAPIPSSANADPLSAHADALSRQSLTPLLADPAGAAVRVGGEPTGVVATNSTAYVANATGNSVSVIDLTRSPAAVTGSPITVGDFPAVLALSSDDSQLFVANFKGDSLTIVNTSDDSIAHTVAVGVDPDGVLEVGSSVYVSNLLSGTLSVVDPATGTGGTPIALPAGPNGQAAPSGIAAIGSKLYVNDVRNGQTDEVDLTAANPTVSATVGAHPAYIAAAGSVGFVANSGSNNVSVLDLGPTPPTVTATIPVGTAPYGIAAASSLGEAFVSASGSDDLDVIDTTSNKVVETVPVGSIPDAVALTPDSTKVLVTNEGDGTLSVLHLRRQPPRSPCRGHRRRGIAPRPCLVPVRY
jgi:YVTN family beta-propeller protein